MQIIRAKDYKDMSRKVANTISEKTFPQMIGTAKE